MSVTFGGSKQGLSKPMNELQMTILFLIVCYNSWFAFRQKQLMSSHCANAGQMQRQPQQLIVLSGTGK